MDGSSNNCVQGAKNAEKIKNLEKEMSETKTAIKEIRDKLLGRPSWAVFFLLTGMSSIVLILIAQLLRLKFG